jgi:hypothetical protein
VLVLSEVYCTFIGNNFLSSITGGLHLRETLVGKEPLRETIWESRTGIISSQNHRFVYFLQFSVLKKSWKPVFRRVSWRFVGKYGQNWRIFMHFSHVRENPNGYFGFSPACAHSMPSLALPPIRASVEHLFCYILLLANYQPMYNVHEL